MSESQKTYGIEGLKKVVDFGATLSIAHQLAQSDGKLDAADIGLVLPPALALIQVLGVASTLPKEFSELDEQEKAELHAYAAETYDLADDKTEAFVERCFKLAVDLGDLAHDAVTADSG